MEKTFCFLINGRSLVLPVTPERATWEQGVNIESINISAVGDVYRAGKRRRYRGQIEGMLPANPYSWAQATAVVDPYYYINMFTQAMEQKTVVRYIVGGTEINAQVLIEGMTYEERDGSGDVYYALSLAEWVDLEAVTVSGPDTAWTGPTTQNSGQTTDAQAQQYTIVTGDMLSVICRRYYGNGGARYYEALANYNGIVNPHLIYPGTTIKIPPESELFGGG